MTGKIQNILCFSGIRACGKSTLIALIMMLTNLKRFKSADMSEILKWRRGFRDSLGEKLREQVPVQQSGGYVDDEPVLQALHDQIKKIEKEEPCVDYLLLGGAPRTPGQLPFFDNYDSRFIHIIAAPREIETSLVLRPRRDDSTPEAIARNRRCYEQQTVPAMILGSYRTCEVYRQDPLLQRLYQCVSHMPGSASIKAQFREALSDKNHPVHKEIMAINSQKPLWAFEEQTHAEPQVQSSGPYAPFQREEIRQTVSA